MRQILFLIAIGLTGFGGSCNPDKDQYEEILFEFAIPLTITPGTDTVAAGQELTLTADFPDSLFDVASQKKYYLPDFDLKTVAVIRKLINPNQSITEQQGAMGKFQITNVTGGLFNLSATFADVSYVYENSTYKLGIKLRALDAGVYAIMFYHSTGTKGSTPLPQALAPNEPGIIRRPQMQWIRYNFNDGATHFNIYKEHTKPADPNETTNWVESKSTYTFVVQ